MFPEKYRKDLESSRRRRKLFGYLSVASVFILCALFAGQLVHEAAHIAWLGVKSCPHRFSWGIGSTGLYGSVKPLCAMSEASLLVFYLSGYTATVFAAGLVGLWGMKSETSWNRLAASSGLLMSVLLSVTMTGDLQTAAGVVGMGRTAGDVFAALLALGVFTTTLESADLAFKRLERQE
jgi:hypothetical protein